MDGMIDKGKKAEEEEPPMEAYSKEYPQLAEEWKLWHSGDLPKEKLDTRLS